MNTENISIVVIILVLIIVASKVISTDSVIQGLHLISKVIADFLSLVILNPLARSIAKI